MLKLTILAVILKVTQNIELILFGYYEYLKLMQNINKVFFVYIIFLTSTMVNQLYRCYKEV